MKRTLALLLACALELSLLAGCSSGISDPCIGLPANARELTAKPIRLSDADMMAHDPDAPTIHAALADFGLELLQQAREEDSTLVSPLSVALALSMSANGAEGDTLAQFEALLGDGASVEAVSAACQGLMTVYQNLTGSTKCSIANSLWADPEGQIRDDFVGRCRGVFDAQVFQAELSAPGIVDDLNSWVSEHTNGMIPRIINQPFKENTACLQVNALYLKNRWSSEFDPRSTHEMDFHHEDGSDSRTDFLSKHDATLSYLQGEGAQGAVLPYDDGRLSFFVLLPDMNTDAGYLSFGDWLDTLEGEALTQLINSREDAQFLSFAMPKFTAEWNGNLEEILPALGVEDAFDPDAADFSSLGNNPNGYYISQVIHMAKFEVNEKGTEAAAATVVAAPSGAAAPPQEGITLVLDRPFLYGIVDLQTGVPLFLGTYE